MKIKIRDTEYPSILEALSGERIFEISKVDQSGEFDFTEQCDQYFSVNLTSDQVRGMAAELLAFIDSKIFCQSCGQPAAKLTCLYGAVNHSWRMEVGKNLCDECYGKATTPRTPSGNPMQECVVRMLEEAVELNHVHEGESKP